MAIFVAIIFQVLFVFFAMIVNIGLLVHDKINLQNSVDLAAYYAASKQAEVLNAMAHVNYQIRQTYKLLAYRLRVVGGFGYLRHPAYVGYSGPFSETQYPVIIPGTSVLMSDQPAICITHTGWRDFRESDRAGGGNESLCQSETNTISQIPSVPVIFDLNPLNAQTTRYIEDIKRQIAETCQRGAVANWRFAAMINYMYKKDLIRRKMALLKLGRSLGDDKNDFPDLEGKSVKEGALSTLKKNLTAGNRAGLIDEYMYNSLGVGGENDTPFWLADIQIDPVIRYVRHSTAGGNACTNIIDVLTTRPTGANIADPGGAFSSVIGEPPRGNVYHSSRGYEKNPWYMAYVGVRAKTSPRQIFAPLGGTVVLKAMAFAKPFGGRMGPWDSVTWEPGARTSSLEAEKVDPLAVPRSSPNNQPTGDLARDSVFLPNYSKYPGDKVGLKSSLAMSMGKGLLTNINNDLNSMPYTDHYQVLSTLNSPQGDDIPFAENAQKGGVLRQAELAAISPDIFDATYYSIDPQFYRYYISPEIRGSQSLGLLAGAPDDHGSTGGTSSIANTYREYVGSAGFTNNGAIDYFYLTKLPKLLLTGWVQENEADYRFPDNKFAECSSVPQTNSNEPPNPGDCIIGGRVGHSVKIISRDYLLSEEHALGGVGGSKGKILNPPPETFLEM